ncbi:unnamed protein product [Alopecurus aequalis]
MAFSPGGTWPVIPIVVLLIGGLFAAFPAASGSRVDAGEMLMMDRFRQWQATHNRSYLSAEERLRRFEVYRANVEYIDATNRRGDLTYELGENQFADLTGEEFLARYASSYDGASGRTDSVITTTAEAGGLWSSGGGDSSLEAPPPASVDWRAKGAVTPVKNQGSECSSCWAFSAVATMESLHFIKTGKLVPLSEQQLPIGVAIEVPSAMQFYRSGVFSGPCGIQMGHAVAAVGYGTDAASGLKYWIVKNSWGPAWGEKGYIRIRRDVGGSSGLCGIVLDTAYPTM